MNESIYKEYKDKVEELNTALRVLSELKENEANRIIESVKNHITKMVIPHIHTLRMRCKNKDQTVLIDIVQNNLEQLFKPLYEKLAGDKHLTPMEIRIADLIYQGRTTKEIAYILGITERGVTFHRANIRKKINLKNKNIHLKSVIMRLEHKTDLF